MMRSIRYKYLLVILSVVFITTLENLYGQNSANNYSMRINTNDVEIVKFVNGYQINIKKKPYISGFRLLLKLNGGGNSYIYIDNSGSGNSIINIKNTDFLNALGDVFSVFIPNTVYLDRKNNYSQFILRDNINLILEAYDINGNTLSNTDIILKPNNTASAVPSISLRNVEKEGDLYAFYLYYSGGENGRYAFYFREGKTNNSYKLINTSFGNISDYDSSGIILEDTFNRELGKKLYIKAYFRQLPEDRYLSFNVFNMHGESFTYPIDYCLETADIKEKETPPPIPNAGNEGAVQIRPSYRVIEQSTNTMIVKRDSSVKINSENETKTLSSEKINIDAKNNNDYNREAADTLNNASKSFNTSNNYVKDADELNKKLKNIVDRYKEDGGIDLVIVLDTTESMHPYLKAIKRDISGIAGNLFNNNKYSRIGFLLYRDVQDTYLTKRIDFSDNINFINREVNYFYAAGGGDKAEPMYEALQEALEKFEYINKKRLIIVLTDAPAKVIGRADLNLNLTTAKEKDITVEFILASEIKEDIYDDHLYFLSF